MRFVKGSIFDSDAQTLVNPVNAVGVSGAGLAKEFKKRLPNMHTAYARACEDGVCKVGIPWLWKGERWVLCFPTKHHWREPSELDFIERGLIRFAFVYRHWELRSVAFPALGCGHGGLSWKDVQPLMFKHLERFDIPVEIYPPEASGR